MWEAIGRRIEVISWKKEKEGGREERRKERMRERESMTERKNPTEIHKKQE
jgi:hypothetical protein